MRYLIAAPCLALCLTTPALAVDYQQPGASVVTDMAVDALMK